MDVRGRKNIDWIDGLKAFAILAILLNHSVESFRFFPWFSSPTQWPPFSERIHSIFPSSGNLLSDIVIFLGWLGDMGPGIFIILSGLTLTLSALNRKRETLDFYRQRALRIYPLYITIHIIILIFAEFIFRWNINLSSFRTLFSLAGLRFTDSLFFYINPSWWFIWLILQMYLLFPLLFRLLEKKGRMTFLIVTLAITLLSRLAGVLDLTYSASFYHWMTGIFGGTRLFEFTAGMLAGSLIYENNLNFSSFLTNKTKLFFISLCIYIFGFLSSLTRAGSVYSGILISLGLAGIFYSLYFLLCPSGGPVRKAVTWLGKNSFSVFLLHQPFMMYASSILQKETLVIALIFITCASFIAGYAIEKAVNAGTPVILNYLEKIKKYLGIRIPVYLIFILIIILSILSFIHPFIKNDSKLLLYSVRIIQLLIPCTIFLFRDKQGFRTDSLLSRWFDTVFAVTVVYLVLTPNWIPIYWLILAAGFILVFITRKMKYLISMGLTFLLILTAVLVSEKYLRRNKPLEVLQWGEMPALQPDEQTGYSLIPSRETRLKYNNYDYILRTNSLGLASPEISPGKDPGEFRIFTIGDAFTMPEGMEYGSAYPSILENDLRTSCPETKINVVNGGVTGYGPNEFLAQMEKYLDTIRPNLVINQFFVNEFQEINLELNSRNSMIGFNLKRSPRRYYFGNAQIPVHYMRTFQKIFEYEDKSYKYNKSLLHLYEKDSYLYSDTVLAKIDRYFDRINELCGEKNCKLLIMFVPAQIVVSDPVFISYFPSSVDLADTTVFSTTKPGRIIRQMCVSKQIPFMDVTDTLKNHRPQPVYFTESWHWNQEGHKVMAGVLSDTIKKMIYCMDNENLNNFK